MQNISITKIETNRTNAVCKSPLPAIIYPAKRDRDRNSILIGISSNEDKNMYALTLRSIKNFNENCRPNNKIGSKNLNGRLFKNDIYRFLISKDFIKFKYILFLLIIGV